MTIPEDTNFVYMPLTAVGYVRMAAVAIHYATNVVELDDWYSRETENRRKLVPKNGPLAKQLHELYTTKRRELKNANL